MRLRAEYLWQKGRYSEISFRNVNGEHSIWGHIAIYTGNSWISDVKQTAMNPYRKPIPYKIFRYE